MSLIDYMIIVLIIKKLQLLFFLAWALSNVQCNYLWLDKKLSNVIRKKKKKPLNWSTQKTFQFIKNWRKKIKKWE